jgi:hypothetical protein
MVMKTIHIQCNEVLQNCSMSPSKLLSHFETEDGENKGKLLLYWTSEFDDWLKWIDTNKAAKNIQGFLYKCIYYSNL